MLRTKNLTYSYSDAEVLKFPDLELQREDQLLVLGSSGTGKSTFLHLLAGLLKPTSGEAEIEGNVINRMSTSKLDRFRGKNIGLVFQRAHFLRSLTVEENLIVAQQLGTGANNRAKIHHTLTELGLEQYQNRSPSRLSAGEQQRLSIARAVINEPLLILADEPTSALDDINALKVAELLRKSAREHRSTLIVVTHDNRLKEIFNNTLNL